MNIGYTVKNSISNHVSKSIWDESHEFIKLTPYMHICYIIHDIIQNSINLSVWDSAYDGVCYNI